MQSNTKPSLDSLEMNAQFEKALHLMEETSHHLFITGKAGTGKSTLLDYFCAHTQKGPVVLAPTGVAALNVKGQTIHSFFNFYIDITPEKIQSKEFKPRAVKIYKSLKTLIIDEVSMVRADLLDCIATFLTLYGPNPGHAFGGVQMIFVGDLYQLPPVVSSLERDIFKTHYPSPYFFSAKAFHDIELKHVELKTVYRQKDNAFLTLLNRVRNNTVSPLDLARLNTRLNAEASDNDDFYITLTTTNKKADEINEEHLGALEGDTFCSKAVISGNFGKEYYPTSQELNFKMNSQIMLLNNDPKKRWVNGSIGIIKSVQEDEKGDSYLQVYLPERKKVVNITPFGWELFKFSLEGTTIVSEPIGTFTQYPFRLAWAVTIHKSQGKTFDKVVIDMGRGAFAAGQTYVALSRCTSFEGVVLKSPIKKHDIKTDPRIQAFMSHFEEDLSS